MISEYEQYTVEDVKISSSRNLFTVISTFAGGGGSSTTGFTGSRVNLGGATGALGGGLAGLEAAGSTCSTSL